MKSLLEAYKVVIILALYLGSASGCIAATNTVDKRPNIVVIVVDDMRVDEYGAGGHPYLETPNIDSLAKNGVMFNKAYHVTPLCSPNRASLVTGQYVSRHGILDNTSRGNASQRLNLFAKDLQAAGYRTAHIGKWHMGTDPTPRPGYDYWVSFKGQGKSYDPDLFEDGRMHQVKGYVTDIFTDRAVNFIDDSSQAKKPFFLYIGHKAVHPEIEQRADGTARSDTNEKQFIMADRHKGRYKGKTLKRSPSHGYQEEVLAQKPVVREALAYRKEQMDKSALWTGLVDRGVADLTIQKRAEMMLAVDESLGIIIDTLAKQGVLNNTMIIFTSDNGTFYGEHDLSIEHRLPYEELVRAPLLIQYPNTIDAGQRLNGFAQSIDIAATSLDVAGLDIPSRVQGKSLMPLMTGEKKQIRDTVYMEFYSHENPFSWTSQLDYRAIQKGGYKYIRWIRYEEEDGGAELYDLKNDPYEMNNLINDPKMAEVLSDLKMVLKEKIIESLGLADE